MSHLYGNSGRKYLIFYLIFSVILISIVYIFKIASYSSFFHTFDIRAATDEKCFHFGVKSLHNATIILTQNDLYISDPVLKIFLSNSNEKSGLYKNLDNELLEYIEPQQNYVSLKKYSNYSICWYDNIIKIFNTSEIQPIFKYKWSNPFEIKYIGLGPQSTRSANERDWINYYSGGIKVKKYKIVVQAKEIYFNEYLKLYNPYKNCFTFGYRSSMPEFAVIINFLSNNLQIQFLLNATISEHNTDITLIINSRSKKVLNNISLWNDENYVKYWLHYDFKNQFVSLNFGAGNKQIFSFSQFKNMEADYFDSITITEGDWMIYEPECPNLEVK